MKPAKGIVDEMIPIKTVETPHGELDFYCMGRVCLYRAETFHTKEPETLEWIDERIDAFSLAFSDTNALATFNMEYTEIGESCHTLAAYGDRAPVNWEQATLTLTVDDFVAAFAPPFPDHMKIDVDGCERRIVHGAMKTLNDPRLRSLMIELDDSNPDDTCIPEDLATVGFEMVSKRHAPGYDSSPSGTACSASGRRPGRSR